MTKEAIVYLKDCNNTIGEVKYMQNTFINYKKHFHIRLNIATIKQGSMNVELVDKEILLKKEDVVIFSPYDIHRTINIDEKDYYILSLSQEWLSSTIGSDFTILSTHLKSDSLHKTIINLYNKKSDITTLKKRLIELRTEIKEDKNNLANRVKSYIINNITDDITVETIAKEMHYNSSYISREFKKAFNISPWQFIVTLRTNLAKESLQGGNISHIAQEFGFFDQSHFNKSFKTIFAIAPKIYKKV